MKNGESIRIGHCHIIVINNRQIGEFSFSCHRELCCALGGNTHTYIRYHSAFDIWSEIGVDIRMGCDLANRTHHTIITITIATYSFYYVCSIHFMLSQSILRLANSTKNASKTTSHSMEKRFGNNEKNYENKTGISKQKTEQPKRQK